MPTDRYTLNQIALVNLLGYTKKEIEAVELSQEVMIEAGVKFAVLFYDGDFKISMHNLNNMEQTAIIDQLVKEYNFCLKGV